MKARLIRIGNPQHGQLVIRSASKPRAGWGQAFEQMHRHRDDHLLDQDSEATSTWDQSEWTW